MTEPTPDPSTLLPLNTARDLLLHPGGSSRGMLALAAEIVVAEYDRRADRDAAISTRDQLAQHLGRVEAQRDAYRAALTELRAASRGLAFFDQIKCARWNAAYQQATQVLGLEDDT